MRSSTRFRGAVGDKSSGGSGGTVSNTVMSPSPSSSSSSARRMRKVTSVPSGRSSGATPQAWLNSTRLRPVPPVCDEWKMIPSSRGSSLLARYSATAWVARYSNASSWGITGRLISRTSRLRNAARPLRVAYSGSKWLPST